MIGESRVENKIGDALVHRIIRAHEEGTPWRACIIVPLLPGFPFPIDHSDSSAVGRYSLQVTGLNDINRWGWSLSVNIGQSAADRTPFSLDFDEKALKFEKLFIQVFKHWFFPQPDDYISFLSLRGWGKLGGETLTTEQVRSGALFVSMCSSFLYRYTSTPRFVWRVDHHWSDKCCNCRC